MARLRLTKVDEYQYLTCFKHSLWGSKSARFKDWHKDDHLAFIVDNTLAGLAIVNGVPFHSEKKVWDNGVFPYRIPIKFIHAVDKGQRIPILGDVREVLTSAWGPRYGWGILNQQVISGDAAAIIIKAIIIKPDKLPEIAVNIDYLLNNARKQRSVPERQPKKRSAENGLLQIEDEFENKEEESLHSETQSTLIRLGKITGCSVWVANNDKGRLFRGKLLGDGCLKSLPNLGLNEEAIKRISLIDTIWIRQNAPVCAFEIETKTSIYSGLLRMSDLISVIPALNIKLFIVAPHKRQEKVLSELNRPTFRKIGLSEFCRFISCENLSSLISKIGDLEGHISTSILDTLAVELEQEFESALD